MKTYQTLYSLNSNGTIQQWGISVEGNVIIKKYGQVNGKIQETSEIISKGKNIGKKNETTPEEQAMAEAQSQWEKKLKSGYCQTELEARQGKVDKGFVSGGVDVMLAHKFHDHKEKVIYPCYSQKKYDGIRSAAIINNGVCTLWSRTRKPITSVPHIVQSLEKTFPNGNIILDGELYNHKYKNSFEEIVSLVRSQSPKENHTIVEYHVYDLIDDILNFEERALKLSNIKFADNKIIKAETRIVNNVEELTDYFNKDRSEGYEGSMCRNSHSMYKHGRSYDLLKIKEIEDGEFEVVSVKAGCGKMNSCAIFLCKTAEGIEFSCKMEGSLSSLEKYLIDPKLAIGKMLIVKFQGMTNGKVPRFPIGIILRDYE